MRNAFSADFVAVFGHYIICITYLMNLLGEKCRQHVNIKIFHSSLYRYSSVDVARHILCFHDQRKERKRERREKWFVVKRFMGGRDKETISPKPKEKHDAVGKDIHRQMGLCICVSFCI